MEVVYRRCCGLDVHQASVTACVLAFGQGGKREARKKQFGTDRKSLQQLRLWLYACKVERVAMESTGVYWKPVWNVLEGHFPLLLANPRHMKNVPGRKTDQNDAEWIADLLAHGLLRASFVPPREIRDLRDLTRYRVKLMEERNRIHNRVGKVLEDANLKLGVVASDILGASGRAMIQRIADGYERPQELAELALNKLRKPREQVKRALYGDVREHHRYMLRQLLEDLERLERKLAELEWEIGKRMQPYEDQVRRLCTVPGVERVTAWTILAELGPDMAVFPDASHAASWAGLAPGADESAGKRRNTRTRQGNRWLRRALCQAGWAATRKKNCQLAAWFRRKTSKLGARQAVVGVAHRLLVIAYHVLRDGSVYLDGGGDYYDRLNPARTAQRLQRRLERLGAEVTLSWPKQQSPPGKRKPGRPCKCAERGIPCTHRRISTLAPETTQPLNPTA